MPTEVIMPRLGWDMKVGSVAEWLKRDGDSVEMGETICMITGDKATTELEAPERGVLRLAPRSPAVGEEVPVGTVLAYLVAPGESLVAEVTAERGAPGDNVMAQRETTADNVSVPVMARRETTGDDASVPVMARRETTGETQVAERTAQLDADRRVVASPRARRAAAALGVDWRALAGSGRGGRILERDVQNAVPGPQHVIEAPSEHPLTGVRRVTAERMALSAQTVAAVTLTTEADATTLVRLRQQALAEHNASDEVPGYTDFMIKIVALALADHPALNTSLSEQGIVQHPSAHVAIAVDTPHGLIAPVIRDAGARTVASIAAESRRLITTAREGTGRPADLEGATFTITNLGMFDIGAFTPIVNLPQCAVLGLGRISARPVVVDEASEQVAVRRVLSLSLTFDHRLVDGAPAARFLQRIKHLVERPTLWLFR
jgi:pyruvate dehydrogenase E2 component (dihydrolipoamide acetyltransferase)